MEADADQGKGASPHDEGGLLVVIHARCRLRELRPDASNQALYLELLGFLADADLEGADESGWEISFDKINPP